MTDRTTCQICGRAILASTGLIAHHGYRRPGGGWQTGSCFGARWRPYEEARDALPPFIDMLRRFKNDQDMAMLRLRWAPPRGIVINRRVTWNHSEPHFSVLRPVGFSAATAEPTYRHDDYSDRFLGMVNFHKMHAQGAQTDIVHALKRYKDWRKK